MVLAADRANAASGLWSVTTARLALGISANAASAAVKTTVAASVLIHAPASRVVDIGARRGAVES